MSLTHPLVSAQSCSNCHGYYSDEHEPWRLWSSSMMAQATRDPVFWACLTIANQDASSAGEMCLRCHSPMGWMRGNSSDPTGGQLIDADFEGVSCSICHRVMDPVYRPGVSPAVDADVLAAMPYPVANAQYPEYERQGNGSFSLDTLDRRRGPLTDPQAPHPFLYSPFHLSPALCANCHEVSNPVYSRQPDGAYTIDAQNPLDAPHPTGAKADEFPLERTYSEWSASAFASGPIDLGGRYGGSSPLVSTCQDCHMPDTQGTACDPGFNPPVRQVPRHFFNGGNTWVLRAVRNLFPDYETGMTDESLEASIGRAEQMLRNASDMQVTQDGNILSVRVINQSGHKLPTGYPEGRRMWVNVKFFDAGDALVAERGAYDDATATLNDAGTKVYEAVLGMDAYAAALTGKPEGPSFHFVLNNKIYKDNRIPPRGYTYEGFRAVQAAPVDYDYEEGQYWDDTAYVIPASAARVEVRVFYQTTSKEYIEFQRDENTTDSRGQIAYDQWVLHGKSAPVEMDVSAFALGEHCPGDFNNSGGTPDDADVAAFFLAWNNGDDRADVNSSGGTPDDADIAFFFFRWNNGC